MPRLRPIKAPNLPFVVAVSMLARDLNIRPFPFMICARDSFLFVFAVVAVPESRGADGTCDDIQVRRS